MKYAGILVMAIMMIVLVALVGVVVVSVSSVPNSTLAITGILGFSSSIIVSLITLIKTEQAKQIADSNAQHLIKTEERVTETVSTVKKLADGAMEKAVKEALNETQVPTTKEDIEALILAITDKVCKDNRDTASQQHLIKHAVANIANFLGLVQEVKRLGLEDEVDKTATGALNPVKKPDCQ
jgi:hypothetical protein